MMQFVIAAPRSGNRVTAPAGRFKKAGHGPLRLQERAGPSIDPMFHRSVLGVESQSWIFIFFCQKYGTGTVRPLCCRARGCCKGPWVFTMGRA